MIFNKIDFNGNGHIQVSEFITASINRERFISDDCLKLSFKMFDTDDSGDIEIFELIKMFYKNGVSEESCKYMFNQIDKN